MRRSVAILVAIVAMPFVLLSIDIGFEFDVLAHATGISLTQNQAYRVLDESNYCDTVAECVLIKGGSAEGQCGSNMFVNIKEVQHVAWSCRRMFQTHRLTDYETNPGDKNPRCIEHKCVAGPFMWDKELKRYTFPSEESEAKEKAPMSNYSK